MEVIKCPKKTNVEVVVEESVPSVKNARSVEVVSATKFTL